MDVLHRLEPATPMNSPTMELFFQIMLVKDLKFNFKKLHKGRLIKTKEIKIKIKNWMSLMLKSN